MENSQPNLPPSDQLASPAESHSSVARRMATGAVWTIAMRLAIRTIGLISTVVLARLLVPADFGLVAIATMVFAMIEIMGAFGFETVLIQNQKARRDYYDTAWTLNVIRGAFTCFILVVTAAPMADFFDDPRLVELIYGLAMIALVGGTGNIGIVDFRKHLDFAKDFRFEVAVKLVAFVATMVAAYLLRNYWALMLGIASSTFARVVLSFVVHPYRPQFSFARLRKIFNFSKWIFLNNICNFAKARIDTFIIGKILGASSLGLYTIAYEIAALASTDVIAPIRRALLPGYSKIADDMNALRKYFIDGSATILMIAAPAAIGLGLTAEPLVTLLLGRKWLDVIPLLQALAVFGFIQTTYAVVGSVFIAQGKPRLDTIIVGCNVLVGVPLIIWATLEWGIHGTVWAVVGAGFVDAIVAIGLAIAKLEVTPMELIRSSWRTIVSLCSMAVAVKSLPNFMTGGVDEIMALIQLLTEGFTGASVYVATHLTLWVLNGRPHGPESIALAYFAKKSSDHTLQTPPGTTA